MSEDLKPIVPVEEQSATVSETTAAQSADEKVVEEIPAMENEEETEDFSAKGLKELVDTLQELLEGDNVQKLFKNAEAVKAAFYKNLKKEKIAAGFQAPAEAVSADGSETAAEDEVVSANPFAEIERGFKDLFSRYKEMRGEYNQEQEKKKEENLKEKLAIIDEIKVLLECKESEDINQVFPKFRELQNRWRAVGPVPQGRNKDVYETYQHNVEIFYDYVKINRELRDLDFKKNLEAKEALCVKAEALVDDPNVVNAFRQLQRFHEEWKELGPVSKEVREEIWARFKAATAALNKKHQEFFESQKDQQKENFELKSALCEKVEAMAEKEVKDSSEWNTLSKEIENIQKEWKKIGFASKKENQKVYDRFRAACDKFFAQKRDFYSDFKSQMQDNMDKKIALCEQAEALRTSEDWKKTAENLVDLQKQWKEIGPVSRKKSEQIWKRFRAACDEFFNNRDKHFGDQDSQFAENMRQKLAIIEEVKAFEPQGDRSENFEALKAFQTRWNEIGFVPFKEKAKVQDAFKKALDGKFAEIRSNSDSDESRPSKFTRNRFGELSGKVDRTVRSEREKLVQKFMKKEQEIQTYENNMGFFSKSKNADVLLEELNKKIDVAKAELSQLEEKIKEFDRQYEAE